MRDVLSFLCRQIQDDVIVVHRKPRCFTGRETGAGAIVPLERRPFRISRLQVISENAISLIDKNMLFEYVYKNLY